jgi:23S rRNA (adenine2503-C2)-methyltransferase
MNNALPPAPALEDLTREELQRAVLSLGGKKAAAASVLARLYKGGAKVLPGLTPALWEKLRAAYPAPSVEVLSRLVSRRDGTVKLLFRFSGGALAESVLLPGKGRQTACISSQSGCACACTFCATGKLGFTRDLRPAEITAQVAACRAEAGGRLDSLVFMGMGEPFLNWDSVSKAIRILSDGKAFGFSQGRMTISTVGVIPGIAGLAASGLKVKLAISVVTSDEDARAKLVPLQRKYPLREVLAAAKNYCAEARAQVLAEYILFEGVNDSAADARKLAALLRGLPCRVNLIPYNSAAGAASEDNVAKAKSFQRALIAAGLRTYLRFEKGADILAACGQLAAGNR